MLGGSVASQQVVVVVHNGAEVVDGPFSRPVRLMPRGTAGVVYGGDVYPLYQDGRIDLVDESVDKWSCPSFVLAGQPVPYAPSRGKLKGKGRDKNRLKIGDWYLESNKFGHYLVFDASEPVAVAVAELMAECGLGVRRWDASHRPSENGVQYDWFIRLEFTGTREDCLVRVRSALPAATAKKPQTGTPAAPAATATPTQGPLVVAAAADELAAYRDAVENLRSSLAESERQRFAALQQVESSTRRAADAEERVTGAHAAGQEAARRLVDSRKSEKEVRAELLRTRRDLAAARLPPADAGASANLAALRNENAKLQSELDEAMQAFIHADSCSKELSDAVAALQARVDDEGRARTALQSQLTHALDSAQETHAEGREAAKAAAARAPRRRQSVESFLERLLPRMRLDPDSVETLLSFPKPLTVLKLLVRLHDNETSVPAVRLRDSLFFEVEQHVHTGEAGDSGMGRIYFAVDEARHVHVRVHRKKDGKDQQRVIKSLRLAA